MNLQMEGAKLRYTLKKPFNLFVDLGSYKEWLPFVESYRTLCIMPNQDMQHVFQSMRGQSVGFSA